MSIYSCCVCPDEKEEEHMEMKKMNSTFFVLFDAKQGRRTLL